MLSLIPLLVTFLASPAPASAPASLHLGVDGHRLLATAPGADAIAWDLDGDGQLDDAAGPFAYAPEGAHHVRVEARWLVGDVPVVRSATRAVSAAAR
jgi:hypothetical protein